MSGQRYLFMLAFASAITLINGQTEVLLFEETFDNCQIDTADGDKFVNCTDGPWLPSNKEQMSLVDGELGLGRLTGVAKQVYLGPNVKFSVTRIEVHIATSNNFRSRDKCLFAFQKPGESLRTLGLLVLATQGISSLNQTFSLTAPGYLANYVEIPSLQVHIEGFIVFPDEGRKCFYDNLRLYGQVFYPPTAQPTIHPTLSPIVDTNTPTLAPTVVPTQKPPTEAPNISPSVAPTLSPTLAPSISPSASPVISPSFAPTVAQTSRAPTSTPTVAITGRPTISTDTPTNAPVTRSPSRSPSTLSPTGSPIVSVPEAEANDAGMIVGLLSATGILAAGAVYWRRRRRVQSNEESELAKGFTGREGRVVSLGPGQSSVKKSRRKEPEITADDERLAEELFGPSPTFRESITQKKQAGRTVVFGEYIAKKRRKKTELQGPSESYLNHVQVERRSMFRPSSGFLKQFTKGQNAKEKILEGPNQDVGEKVEDDIEV